MQINNNKVSYLTMACFPPGNCRQNLLTGHTNQHWYNFLNLGKTLVLHAPHLKSRGRREPMALTGITSDKSLEALLSQPPVQLWCLTWQLSTFLV